LLRTSPDKIVLKLHNFDTDLLTGMEELPTAEERSEGRVWRKTPDQWLPFILRSATLFRA